MQAPWEAYCRGKVEGVLSELACCCAPRQLQSQRSGGVSCLACLVMQVQYFLRVLLENIGDISTAFNLCLRTDPYSCINPTRLSTTLRALVEIILISVRPE